VKKESVICKTVEDMADKTLELLMDNHKRRSLQKGDRVRVSIHLGRYR